MFSAESFNSGDPSERSVELSDVDVKYGKEIATPISLRFQYDRNYDPRFYAEFLKDSYKFSQEDHRITFANIDISEDFLQIKSTWKFEEKWNAVFSPRTEPFLWGSPEFIDKATFVVLNGPDTYFGNRNLVWKTGKFTYEYSFFDEAREFLRDPRLSEKQVLPTGTLKVSCESGTSVEPIEARRQAYLASRALTFMNGIGVSVGHGELSRNDSIAAHYIGFTRCDPLNHHKNWFDIEVFGDAGEFLEKFMNLISDEPPTLPVSYATDFYRTSNAIRDSSLEMAVIASYSALEVLVSYILREKAGWSNSLLGPRTNMADKMRACTRFCGLQDNPLSRAVRISKKLKSFNNYDDYDVFAETRNSIVPSDKSFKLEGFELHEVWLASQWLVEVLIFFMIGYRGRMADRRPMTGWRGQHNGNVPLN